MNAFRKTLSLAVVVSVAVGGSVLQAQTSADESPAEVAPAQKEVTLSPAEMKTASEEHLKDMQTILVRVVELQALARKQKDVIKLNCVNDKLLQVKQLLNIAEAGRTDLIEAIAQQDNDSTLHQFSQISIAKEKTDGLHGEAEGCIGEELIFLGPTEVTVDEPGIPDDPTGDDQFDWANETESPGYASPFL